MPLNTGLQGAASELNSKLPESREVVKELAAFFNKEKGDDLKRAEIDVGVQYY